MFGQPGLFDGPAPVLPERFGAIRPHPYQREAYEFLFRLFDRGLCSPMCVFGTGLGKSVLAGMIAGGLGPGRVMIVVDVGLLAMDLARTAHAVTGEPVGVLTGLVKEGYTRNRIVVATAQTLWRKDRDENGEAIPGTERYREMDPREWSGLIVDEAEASLANEYSGIVRHFQSNPLLKTVGLTATPVRTDGVGMGRLFDYVAVDDTAANPDDHPLNRDLRWGIREGRLVRFEQGFVRVSVDFSSLRIVRNAEGDEDYTDAQLAGLFDTEQKFVELAHGIDRAANGESSIVICPNDVEFARVLAHHLCAVAKERSGLPDQAEAVYGRQGRKADDLLKRFKVGQFPYVVACKKLEKGFDSDLPRHVFMVRKTKSQRVYCQAAGRGSRPLVEIRKALAEAPDAEARRAIIAASAKPKVIVWDLVGIDASVKDMTLVDVLAGRDVSEQVRERAKAKQIAGAEGEVERVIDEAKDEVDREERALAELRERQKRAALKVRADVEIEVTDNLGASGGGALFGEEAKVHRQPITEPQLKLLICYGVTPEEARTFHRGQVHSIVSSLRNKGRRYDEKLYRAYVNQQNQQAGTPGSVPPSQWQVGKLRQLGYEGPNPPTHAVARTLITQLEERRRAARSFG